ncbi:MAG: hypothetical protein CMQ34_09845 [Gammaproteobacteria bacterium]|nr:hypothetical protein [Gammaproteobacteria bacterium]
MLALTYGARKYWPRGLRNNNPGNIRHNPANNWYGMTGQDRDGFVIFGDPADGIDAIGEIIDSYQRRGIWMLRNVIETWAPGNGKDQNGKAYTNSTEAYLSHVMQLTGWQAAHVPQRTEGDYVGLVKAIITHENGRNPYSDEFIAASLARPT